MLYSTIEHSLPEPDVFMLLGFCLIVAIVSPFVFRRFRKSHVQKRQRERQALAKHVNAAYPGEQS